MEPRKRLLIVDDNALFREAASDFFSEQFSTLSAGTLAEGKALVASEFVDFAVLDKRLPDGSGLELCQALLQSNPVAKVVYVTAFPSFEHVVKALKAGAHDYLSKPFELLALEHAVENLVTVAALERTGRLEAWRAGVDRDHAMLVGKSAAMTQVRRVVDLASRSGVSVLVTGETGTGKNLVARAIHHASSRKEAPLVTLNCAALPENLIEAELFGWERGAFTGAVSNREGVLRMAEGGTLFLDEIGEMPLHLQAKLLSVLEDRQIMPLGGRVWKPVNVRIIAATNAQLEQAVEARRFRADLFFRLNVLRIEVPPLRERREDIGELCGLFLQGQGRNPALYAEDELLRLTAYAWPGNVRELKNVLERAWLLNALPSTFLAKDSRLPQESPQGAQGAPFLTLEEVESRHIASALQWNAGNLTQSAKALGISLSTLKRRIRDGAPMERSE
jgi:DNA-binding NtrC family response regulator